MSTVAQQPLMAGSKFRTHFFCPHDYQKAITNFIVENTKSFVIVDMGLGKTAATLQALEVLFDQFMIQRVLVIAPLRVARHVWPAEIEKWGFDLSYACALGTQQQRVQALKQRTQVHIINRENVPWLVKSGPWIWDMVIIDESSSFKNHSSQRFRALRSVIKKVRRVVLLTGTPAPNSLLELWPQVYLLDRGQRLGTGITRYRYNYFFENEYTHKWIIRPGCADKIYNKIKDLTISMRQEDYLKLPDRIDINCPVDLPSGAMDVIKELEQEFTTEIAGEDITAANAAVLTGKLLQASGGAIYDCEGVYRVFHGAKFDALEEIIEHAQDENILVAYSYQHEEARLKSRFPWAVNIKEKGAIDRWNNGKIRLMIAHPASAGHGLNLQNGGSIIVWLSLTWSLELWLQFNARVHRQGQAKPVRIYRIIAEQTIDREVLARLDQKKAGQDALRCYLEEKCNTRLEKEECQAERK